jgi:NAD(P)-dependent dehydrogenase (short-subunit alcohol dehydrogenase family)
MSEGTLAGRGVVVTGGSRGIGAAVARRLAASGASIVVAARTAGEIDRLVSELKAHGAKAWAVPCDVTDEISVKRLGLEARRHLGAVDILICSAGAGASAPLAKITLAEWNRMLTVNATGAFLTMREFLGDMVTRQWGRIVCVASIAGLQGGKYISHYSAAKHAVVGLVRSVAREVEKTAVTVNAVCPAYVDTPMTERTIAGVQTRSGLSREEALAAVLGTIGQERLIAPDEVASRVLELCEPQSEGITGQAIMIEGKEAAWPSRS